MLTQQEDEMAKSCPGERGERPKYESDWEEVAQWTTRLAVPGGWLYRYCIATTEGLVFVPYPETRHPDQ
jgi:hypothetical protein